MKLKITLGVLACCFQLSCTDCSVIPDSVVIAVNSSGRNKNELRKVLAHYQGSPVKLKAACFLIENMVDQYHYEGKGKAATDSIFAIMDSLLRSGHGIFNRSWDSIQAIHPLPDLSTVYAVRDIESLKADFLIRNIDDAFVAWQYPWAKNLSFDEFCEYILPYKLVNEDPDNWRAKFKKRYSCMIAGLVPAPNSRQVCLAINKDLKKWFYVNAKFGCEWNVNSTDLEKIHTGRCSDATQLAAYAMRAMGVPVVMDSCPFWGNKNLGHEWDALLAEGRIYHFVGSESDPGKEKLEFTREEWIRRKKPKVFRHTYRIQMKSLAALTDDINQIPELFRDRHILDVTGQYSPVKDISLKLNANTGHAKYAYITVFNQKKWEPVFWGEVSFFNHVTFKDMGEDIVYLPMYFQSGRLRPAGDAFLFTGEGDIIDFLPDMKNKTEVRLDAKYPEGKSNRISKGKKYELFYWNNEWVSLGKQVATGSSLSYPNVPGNSLLWLCDLGGGVDERIFIYKNGRQIWL